MEHIALDYVIDVDDVAAHEWHVRPGRSRARVWFVGIVAGIWLLACVVGYAWGNLAWAAIAFVGVPVIVAWSLWCNDRARRAAWRQEDGLLGPYQLVVTPNELRGSNSEGTGVFPWSAIGAVDVTGRHIFLRVLPSESVIVPRRVFARANDEQRFLDAVAHYRSSSNDTTQFAGDTVNSPAVDGVRLTFVVSAEDYVRMVQGLAWHDPLFRAILLRSISFTVIVTAVCFFGLTWWFTSGALRAWWPLVSLLLGLAVSPPLCWWTECRQIRRSAEAGLEGPQNKSVELTSTEFRSSSSFGEDRWLWRTVRAVYCIDEGLVICMCGTPVRLVVVPSRAFVSKEKREEFLSRARNYIHQAQSAGGSP